MPAQSKRRLGRGLEALLGPSTTDKARASGDLIHVPLDAIKPNPFQPRAAFDETAIKELAASLDTAGLLQPIVVRPVGSGGYELIAGERRWRAAKQLGWNDIGAVVREVDDRTLLTLALVENLQRDALSPIDEAKGYSRLVEDFNATHAEVAELVGRSRSTVANALRLLRLPDAVQDMVHRGELDMGHARALLRLEGESRIELMARAAVDQGWSVRETETQVRGKTAVKARPRKRKGDARLSPEARRIQTALRRFLGTDVSVTERANGTGMVAITFYSNDDLTRILELVMGAPFDG